MRTSFDSPSLVFRGLALLHLGQEEGSETSYLRATEVDGSQVLAWQGLEKLYSTQKQWAKLGNVYHHLADIALSAGDAEKCGNALTKLIALRRQHGSYPEIAQVLLTFVPPSKYCSLLETLPVPDQAAPASNPAFNAQMLVHVGALENVLELIDLLQKADTLKMDEIVKKQKSTLEGAKLGMTLLRNQATATVSAQSRVPSLYEYVINSPRADDKMRRDMEGRLLRFYHRFVTAIPTRGPSANAGLKKEMHEKTYELAKGAVLLGISDELAWSIFLDWGDFALVHLPYMHLLTFVKLFPRSARTNSIRALLRLVGDEAYQRGDAGEVTREQILKETDLLQLALDGLDNKQDTLFAQRIVALFYLLDKDYASALDILLAAHSKLGDREASTGAPATHVTLELNAQLATAYTHLHPPKYHKEAQRLTQAVLAKDGTNLDARFDHAYLCKARGAWFEARRGFEVVISLAAAQAESLHELPESPGRNLAALQLSPDARLEAEAELANTLIELKELVPAKDMLDAMIEQYDNDDNVFGAEFRARLWYLLGRCFWAMGGEFRKDAQHAYRCYVTAIKRCGSFAPAFTALGKYYETEATPPDLVRASKCFQKAFEMDATEFSAAQRLVEHFADQREWGLVDVIARRVIEAEGGVEALAGRPKSGIHVSPNAWVWKAVGIVEALNNHPEQAIVALQVTLRSNPHDVDAWVRMGEAYLAFGRPIPALKTFGKALQLLGATPSAGVEEWHIYYNVAEAQRRLGRFDRAVTILAQIAEQRPEQHSVRAMLAETRLDEGRRLLASGYAARAHSTLRHAIYDAVCALRADKLLSTAWKVAGDACFYLSKLDLGRAPDDAAAVAPPQGAAGLRSTLYELVLMLGQLDLDARLAAISAVSAADLTAAIPADDDWSEPRAAEYAQHAVLCYKYIAQAQSSESKVTVFSWADLATGLARLAATADEATSTLAHEQAVQCVRLALSIKPQARLWLLLGNLHFARDVGTAQHAYIMAIESSPKSPVPWTSLGFLYLSQGDAELAEQAFLRAQTTAPDWPMSWLGRALLAEHGGDARARLALFEHAYTLAEGTSLEADYGFAMSAFVRLRQGAKLSQTQVLSPLLALNHYVARAPVDDAGLHLSALLAEQLGADRLAIERIERAAAQLEAGFEATESTALALKYGIASMNLGRIRLARRDADGAIEAFEGALALLGEEDTEAVPVHADQLQLTRTSASVGIAHAHFMQGAHADGIAELEAARAELHAAGLADDAVAAAHAEIAVLLARMRWQTGDRTAIAEELDTAYVPRLTQPRARTDRLAAHHHPRGPRVGGGRHCAVQCSARPVCRVALARQEAAAAQQPGDGFAEHLAAGGCGTLLY